jgi:hypothetical protein
LTGYGRARSGLYKAARLMGDLRPFLELDGKKIVRRGFNKGIGRHLGQAGFNDGGVGELLKGWVLMFVKGLLGLGRR